VRHRVPSGGEERCPEVLEEGVYRYVPGRGWVPGLPEPGAGKPVVLVFVNALCKPGCERAARIIWEKLGRLIEEGRVYMALVVCTRFRYVCYHDEAKQLFAKFGVIASPTIVVLQGGKVLASVKGSFRVSRELAGVLEELASRLSGEARAAKPRA
jgi:thioredoxin-like negative regulator of GroEL